jgi:toxin ParE1/3/4
MTVIVVSSAADHDIASIIENLATKAGKRTAEKYADLFDMVYKRLALFPGSGPRRARLGSLTRIAVVSPYVMFYDYDSGTDTVVVLRILHGRRRITRRIVRV